MRVPFTVVVTLVLLAGTLPAGAQTPRPERPYRGLFGGGGLSNPSQRLTASGSLGGGWDSNVMADALFGDRPARRGDVTGPGGAVTQGSAGLRYSLNLPSLQIGASGTASASHYPSLEQDTLLRYSGALSGSARASRDITVHGSLSYMPYDLSRMFPAGVMDPRDMLPPELLPFLPDDLLPALDLSSSLQHYVTYSGGVGYQRQLSRRTSLTGDYLYRNRGQAGFWPEYEGHRFGGGVQVEVSRDLSFRAGYRFSDVDYGGLDGGFAHHFIDVGIDYNRSLSFSRRTTLTFTTGTAALSRPRDEGGVGIDVRFRAIGSAVLNHELGRTWNTSVAYHRRVHVSEMWGAPGASDSFTATLGGLVNRRVSFSSSARATTGRMDHSDAIDFNAYHGHASLGYALTQHLNASLTYGFYRHWFDQGQGFVLPTDFVHALNRHSLRVSFSLWAPVFEQARRGDAAR